MKKLLFALFCTIMVLFAKSQDFVIEGRQKEKLNDKLVLEYLNADKINVSDTIVVNNGQFSVRGKIQGCSVALLKSIGKTPNQEGHCVIFLEPRQIKVAYYYGKIKAAKIEGSATQLEYEQLNKSMSESFKTINVYLQKSDAIRKKIKDGNIDPKIGSDSLGILFNNALPAIELVNEQKIEYIKNNPASYLSLDLLWGQISKTPDERIDSLYKHIAERIKNSSVDDNFIRSYTRYKKLINTPFPFENISIGQKAPRFAYLSRHSKDSTTNLSLLGKVYLIEFWGLGCLPCLRLNLEIEKIRRNFKKDDFEVIAVSRTSLDNLADVKRYLKKNKLYAWTQVSINKEMTENDDLMFRGNFDNYNALELPRSVLVDRNGNVIYKSIGISLAGEAHLKSLIEKAVAEKL